MLIMSEYFDIKVTDVKENEDGSAVVTIEMCEKARDLLIEAGFVSLLRKHIDEIERSEDD